MCGENFSSTRLYHFHSIIDASIYIIACRRGKQRISNPLNHDYGLWAKMLITILCFYSFINQCGYTHTHGSKEKTRRYSFYEYVAFEKYEKELQLIQRKLTYELNKWWSSFPCWISTCFVFYFLLFHLCSAKCAVHSKAYRFDHLTS